MSRPPEGVDSPPLSLTCSSIVYRLLLKQSWIDPDTGQVQAAAFERREKEDGLSVFVAALCASLDEAIAISTLRGVKAGATLHVGHVRDLGLNVLSDPVDNRHAEIVGVPRRSEDQATASYLADLLAEQARVVHLS